MLLYFKPEINQRRWSATNWRATLRRICWPWSQCGT